MFISFIVRQSPRPPNALVQGRADTTLAKHDDASPRVPWNHLLGPPYPAMLYGEMVPDTFFCSVFKMSLVEGHQSAQGGGPQGYLAIRCTCRYDGQLPTIP